MHCAIIAAGEGSRLAAESVTTPKPLIDLDGNPMISRLAHIMAGAGAAGITVAVRADMPQVTAYVRSMTRSLPCPLHVMECVTAGSMLTFAEISRSVPPGPLVVTTVDSVFLPREFDSYIRAFAACNADALMAVTDYVDDEKPLYIVTGSDMRITAFSDSAPAQKRYISGGIYGLNQRARDLLESCLAAGMTRMRQYQRQLLAHGLSVRAFPFSKIIDVDHASDIATARQFITSNTPS